MIRYFYIGMLVAVAVSPALGQPATDAPPSSKGSIKVAEQQAAAAAFVQPKAKVTASVERKPAPAVVFRSTSRFAEPIGAPILGNRIVAFPSATPSETTSCANSEAHFADTPVSHSEHSSASTVSRSDRSNESAISRSDRSDDAGRTANGRLARVTAYWAGEGDYYTGRSISATGVRLHDGHCAVDPSIIPYGSVVEIAGVGKFLAVDTGSAVISRTAAREGGHTAAERSALVVDIFFADASEGEKFAARAAKFVSISWWKPNSADGQALAHSLFAQEDWTKIQSKQL